MLLVNELAELSPVASTAKPKPMRKSNLRRIFLSGVQAALTYIAVGMSLLAGSVSAESRGHYSITYQYISVDGFEATFGKVDIGTTDTHTLLLDLDYALNTRWTASIGLPIVRKRYEGGAPHIVDNLDPAQDSEFIDDGKYRTDFQDLHLGLRYKLLEGRPWSVEPFVGFSFPTNDYPFYGHAAVGQGLWHLEMGATITYVPHFYDYYVSVAPSYVVVEEIRNQSINHFRLNATLGYRFTDRVGARVFVMAKEGSGLDNTDFPQPQTNEAWYFHDQTIRHNYVNAGLGVDWNYSEGQSVSLSAMRMIHADVIHIVDFAYSLTFSKSF